MVFFRRGDGLGAEILKEEGFVTARKQEDEAAMDNEEEEEKYRENAQAESM